MLLKNLLAIITVIIGGSIVEKRNKTENRTLHQFPACVGACVQAVRRWEGSRWNLKRFFVFAPVTRF